MAEFHPNTAGNAVLDNAGSFYQPSAASQLGPPFTSSGESNVTCGAVMSSGSFFYVGAASLPYDANAYLPGGRQGFSCATSSNVPIWKPASPTAVIAMGFSLALNPSPGKEQSFIDFEGGQDGVAPTEATLRASTHGWQGGLWRTSNIKTMVFATAANHPLQNPAGRLFGDGINYASGAGTLGIKITGAAPTAQTDYISYSWSNSKLTDMSAGAWYYTDLSARDQSSNDCFSIHGAVQQFAAVNCYGGLTRYIRLETPAGNGSIIKISSSTWYWIQIHWHFDGISFKHTVTVRDTGGTLIGTSSYGPFTALADYPAYLNVGKVNHSTMTNGRIQYLDSIKISLVGEDPIGQ
jgi:hypothetical protein